jgi:hypothetical protein
VSERSHRRALEGGADEETAGSPEALADPLATRAPESSPESAPDSAGEQERASPLDMLFREAEVIARNLKESGTRR